MSHFTFRTFLGALAVCTILLPASAASTSDTESTALKLEEASGLLGSTSAITSDQAAVISESLLDALRSDHRGLESSALRLIIEYGEAVDVNHEAVIEIARLYRDKNDDRLQRMAVVALGATENSWAQDFLSRSARFESDDVLRGTIVAVLHEAS